ncbi:Tol-Pal system protein TolQ [Nymphon striatum]|nr:Tol-Pal system protein TolQ [Nymphon striatum]
MIGLLAASIWTWAIVVDKMFAFRRMRTQLNRFEENFWSGQSLEELYRTLSDRKTSGMGSLFVAAMREWKKSFERGARSPISLQSRIDRAMDVALVREMDKLEARLGFLASVGSVAVYVGLFGTVIGIMTSFQAIAGSDSTNLAVVAPGIAEALLATAIGLLAAIPALLAYNKLTTDVGKIGSRLEAFADEFSGILSRQIDERAGSQQTRYISRRKRNRRPAAARPIAEINVTPFVDVMLVLLIIFMVAAPLLTVGVPIDLPETQAKALNSDTQPITISVNGNGEIFLQETIIPIEEVVPKLEAIAETGYDERIYIRGDQSADYGTIMKVMGRINQAGFKNLGLVTLQESDG